MTGDPYECASCGPSGYTRLTTRARDGNTSKQAVECTSCGRSWRIR